MIFFLDFVCCRCCGCYGNIVSLQSEKTHPVYAIPEDCPQYKKT